MRQPSPSRRARLAALTVVSIAAAALVPAALYGCGDNTLTITSCITPTLDEKAADGGPDPCHCDPPPSLNLAPCGCLSNPKDTQAVSDYEQCVFNYNGEKDAGAP